MLRTPTDVMEKQLALITRGSTAPGEEAFKFPLWHFCGDTLVKIIKVKPQTNETDELSITATVRCRESS